MPGRPIVLPELPYKEGTQKRAELEAYARAAVEADRKGIVVTLEDIDAAEDAAGSLGITRKAMRAALESFAARKRGET